MFLNIQFSAEAKTAMKSARSDVVERCKQNLAAKIAEHRNHYAHGRGVQKRLNKEARELLMLDGAPFEFINDERNR